MTRASNTVDDAIKGVTLSLGAVTPTGSAATRVDVAIDSSAMEQKAQTIVDAYNSIAKLLHGQLDYTGTTLGPDTLFGDSTAQGLRRQLSDAFANAYSFGGGSINASTLGIRTLSDGTLTIDDAKFKAAITADPSALQHVLIGDGSSGAGLVGALNSLVASYTQYGTGALVTEEASKQSQIKGLDHQITRIENRAASLETSLRSQFAALDALESSLTAQTSYIASLFPTTTTTA
jgi:flagellar hook-associated protein 2